MEKITREEISLLALFVGVSILLFFVFKPFFPLLVVAAVLAILLQRPYEMLTRLFGGSKNAAAALVVVLVVSFLIIPLFFLGTQIYKESQTIFTELQGNGSQYIQTIKTLVERPLQQISPAFTVNINTYVSNALVFISNHLGSLVYQTLFVAFDMILMLLAFFFFLRDGRDLLNSVSAMSPLGEKMTRQFFDKMHQTIRSVLLGTVANAFIRWFCIWAAFSLFSIPNAVLWSGVGAVIGAIPGLGTPFVLIPAVVYLYFAGNVVAATGLAAVGLIVVLLVDNMLAAYFFGQGLAVSPVFVLFSILGGLFLFGPLGFILGPIVLSVFLSVVRVYEVSRQKA